MDIREAISKNPGVGAAIGGVLIVVAAVVIFRHFSPEPTADDRLYFSDDDGKTWFLDAPNHISPYDHGGKQAVRCFLFQSGSSKFIGYIQKYSENVRAKIVSNTPCSDAELRNGTLVKRPGDAQWTPLSDPRSADILNPKDPNNPGAQATRIDE
jgi:hypothetical protein